MGGVACVNGRALPCFAHFRIIIYENRILNLADFVFWRSILHNMIFCDAIKPCFAPCDFCLFCGAGVSIRAVHGTPRNNADSVTDSNKRVQNIIQFAHVYQVSRVFVRLDIFFLQQPQPVRIIVEVSNRAVHVEVDSFHVVSFLLDKNSLAQNVLNFNVLHKISIFVINVGVSTTKSD